MKSLLRVGATLGLDVLAGSVMALPAGAAVKVGPNQYFTGVINGRNGNTATPIPIRMACFGPVKPGETGHPMSGQTLAVHELFPPTATQVRWASPGRIRGSACSSTCHPPSRREVR